MFLFTEVRTLWVALPDGAKLFFKEPELKEIKAELGLASLPPASRQIAKLDLYRQLVDRIEPESSIYNFDSESSPTMFPNRKITKEVFEMCLMGAMIAPPPMVVDVLDPETIDDFLHTTWVLGDSDLNEKGKSLWVQISNNISIIHLTSQLENANPSKFIEIISSIFQVADNPEFLGVTSVAEFVSSKGVLTGIYYQQLITIASNFFRTFPKVERKF